MSKSILVSLLLFCTPLAYADLGIYQNNQPASPAVQPTEEKTLEMMQKQTTDQVQQQVEEYNAKHPIPTEGLSPPTQGQPGAPAPAPVVVTTPPPAAAPATTDQYSTMPARSPKNQGYTGFQSNPPPNQNTNTPAKSSGGWNIKY